MTRHCISLLLWWGESGVSMPTLREGPAAVVQKWAPLHWTLHFAQFHSAHLVKKSALIRPEILTWMASHLLDCKINECCLYRPWHQSSLSLEIFPAGERQWKSLYTCTHGKAPIYKGIKIDKEGLDLNLLNKSSWSILFSPSTAVLFLLVSII